MFAVREPAAVLCRPGRPSIAVVICTRDRTDSLQRTLDSVWRQTLAPDELLIIDDGRLPDAVRHDLSRRAAECGIVFRYHAKDRPGLTSSRNLAASFAESDVLLFLDDDVTCDERLLDEVADAMREPRVAALTATVLEPTWSDLPARVFQWGYRLAGWWAIRPRRHDRGPPPAALSDPGRRATRFLSGAAMALRREIVLAHPFDTALDEYALGEDREMAYRLAPRYWLLQSSAARVVHRREPGPRGSPRRFGFMTAFNYLYILRKTCPLGAGDAVVLTWTFLILSMMHIAYGLLGDPRSHLVELAGLVEGLWAAARSRPRRESSPPPPRPPAIGRWRSPRIRALFVTNRLEHGGAEWMLLNLTRHLPPFGVDPEVACLQDAGPLAAECRSAGVPVFEKLLRFKTDAGVIPRLRDLIRRRRIDLIVAVGSGGDRMFWSTLAGRSAGIPVVVWSHWCPTPAEPRFERANRAVYRVVDRFVALGARHARALARIEYVPAGRIAVIRNGIDLSRYDRAAQRPHARRLLRLDPDAVGIALIANLRREKRHDVFVAAARRVLREHPHARFFIIGDGPHRDAVHTAVRQVGLSDSNLRMMGARDDVPLLLAGLDAVCLCSDLECFSLTMLEAAASGCAFVGPLTGSLDELLEDGRTGLVVRPADPVTLAAALDRLIRDPALRRRLADEAGCRVREAFRIENTAQQFADLFQSLIVRASRVRISPAPRGSAEAVVSTLV